MTTTQLRVGLLLVVNLFTCLVFAAGELTGGFVQVIVYRQAKNVVSPWTAGEISDEAYIGTVIAKDSKVILITAAAVLGAARIEMLRFGETTRWQLDTVFVDEEANLAILRPRDLLALRDARAVALGRTQRSEDRIEILALDATSQLSVSRGKIVRFSVAPPPTSAYPMLRLELKVEKKYLGWSEPVLEHGALVGLIADDDREYVHAIPLTVIQHFLKDSHNESYRGFPDLGIVTGKITSPAMREALGLLDGEHGVRIEAVATASPFYGLVFPEDVLLAIDGVALTDRETIAHETWGNVHYFALLNQRYGDEAMQLTISHNGAIKKIRRTLLRYDSNLREIPFAASSGNVPHLIFGGFVLQELSLDYLKSWGNDWMKKVNSNLLYLWLYKNELSYGTQSRHVVLNKVLPDEFNRGYERLENLLVEEVNGQRIDSLKSLRAALGKPIQKGSKEYAHFVFRKGQGEAILGYRGLSEVHGRIAENFGVNTQDSFFKRE